MTTETIQVTLSLRTIDGLNEVARANYIQAMLKNKGIPAKVVSEHEIVVSRGRLRWERRQYENCMIITWWSK